MFQLATVKDIVRVQPENFNLNQTDAITSILSQKYANKVIHDVGLCIRIFDLVSVSGHVVHACQDGAYTTRVVFRLVVFRPFVGEVLVGEIKSSTSEGIHVSLDFFDDITIPAALLQPKSVWDAAENRFVWHADGDTQLPYTKGTAIRFRVQSEVFEDVGPTPPALQAGAGRGAASAGPDSDANGGAGKSDSGLLATPYRIVGSAHEEGFGSPGWWQDEES